MENQENDPTPEQVGHDAADLPEQQAAETVPASTPPIPTDEEVENEPVPDPEPVPEEDFIKPDDAANDDTIDDEEDV